MSDLPILSVITFLPLAGAVLIAFLPSGNPSLIRRVALGVALLTWALSLGLLVAFALSAPPLVGSTLQLTAPEYPVHAVTFFRYKEAFDWIPSFGIQYKLGVDGLSVLMVVLTTTLSWISILASFGPIKDRVKEYMISFLVLEVGMIGVFVALDLFLFYIFWELVLVPMYLIIGIWGGANRIYATMKLVLYTLVG